MMQDYSKRGAHTRLVLKMADRQEIDLSELVMRGEFSIDDLDHAIDKCVGCTKTDDCAQFLASEPTTVSLPDYCRNGDVFRALKAQ